MSNENFATDGNNHSINDTVVPLHVPDFRGTSHWGPGSLHHPPSRPKLVPGVTRKTLLTLSLFSYRVTEDTLESGTGVDVGSILPESQG